jgi:hypothetical protein
MNDIVKKLININTILKKIKMKNKNKKSITLDYLYNDDATIFINPINKENIRFPQLNNSIIVIFKSLLLNNQKTMLLICNKQHASKYSQQRCTYCHDKNEQKLKLYIQFFNKAMANLADVDILNILEYVTVFLILTFPVYNTLINIKKIYSYIHIINISNQLINKANLWDCIIKKCNELNINYDFIFILLSFVSLLDTRTKKCQKDNCNHYNNCNFICNSNMWQLCIHCLYGKISMPCNKNNKQIRHYRLPFFNDKLFYKSNNNNNKIDIKKILGNDIDDPVIYDILIKNGSVIPLSYSCLSNIGKSFIEYKKEITNIMSFMEWINFTIENYNSEISINKITIENNIILLEELLAIDHNDKQISDLNIKNIKLQNKNYHIDNKLKYIIQYFNIINIMKSYKIKYSQAKCYYSCIFNNSISKYIPIDIVIYAFTLWNGTNAYSIVKGFIEFFKELLNCNCKEIRELKILGESNDINQEFINMRKYIYELIINFLSSIKIYGFYNININTSCINDSNNEWDIIINNVMNYIFDYSYIDIRQFINFLKNGNALWLYISKYGNLLTSMENISLDIFKELFELYKKLDIHNDDYKLVLLTKNKIPISSRFINLKSKIININNNIIININNNDEINDINTNIGIKHNKIKKINNNNISSKANKITKFNNIIFNIKNIKNEFNKLSKFIKLLDNITTNIGYHININNFKYIKIELFNDEYLDKVKEVINDVTNDSVKKSDSDSDSDTNSEFEMITLNKISKLDRSNDSDDSDDSDDSNDLISSQENNSNIKVSEVSKNVSIVKPKKIFSKKYLKSEKKKYKEIKQENKNNKSITLCKKIVTQKSSYNKLINSDDDLCDDTD